MPEEKNMLRPEVDQAEWDGIKAQTDRTLIAARALLTRNVTGIPRRPYLIGQNDTAPMLQGLVEFSAAVWALIDAIGHCEPMPAVVEDAASVVIDFMEDLPGK